MYSQGKQKLEEEQRQKALLNESAKLAETKTELDKIRLELQKAKEASPDKPFILDGAKIASLSLTLDSIIGQLCDYTTKAFADLDKLRLNDSQAIQKASLNLSQSTGIMKGQLDEMSIEIHQIWMAVAKNSDKESRALDLVIAELG